MKLALPFKISTSSPLRIFALGALAVVLIIVAGLSGLVYPSIYAPLIFLSGITAIVVFMGWLAKPAWALYAALFLVFLPLGLIPSNIHSMLNRFVTVVAAGVCLIHMLWFRKKIVWARPALFMLFFLIWSGVTLLWAEKMAPAMNALQVYALRFLLFLFLIPNEINTKRELDGLMNALAFSGWVLISSFIGTLWLEGYTSGSRLTIFGGNENGAGVLALIFMVGVLWQASQPSMNHQLRRKSITAIYILLTFGIVVMTGSRGSALSLVVTLGIFCVWKPLRSWGKFGFFVGILALIFTPWIWTTLVERFAVEAHDTLLGGRETLWQASWHLIQSYPLGGVGIGNAPYAILSYLEADPRIVGAQRASIHNPILTIWSETGIPGIIFYLGLLTSALISFGKRYLEYRKLGCNNLLPYFALVSSVTLGYMVSWFKGGGMESSHSYFLILALLTLPSVLETKGFGIAPPSAQILENQADR